MNSFSDTKVRSRRTGELSTDLLKGSIRFFTIVLMVTAAAAPLVVVSTYIPLSMGFGAGIATPITYLGATLILLIFAVGFAQMAKRITASGAFYNFATHGLGKSVGLGTGMIVMVAYSMIVPAIGAGFGFFLSKLIETYLGFNVPWWASTIFGILLMYYISYFRVTITGRVLGIALVLEVLIVFVLATVIIFKGGAQGPMPESLNPASWAVAPAVGIGFFFAFWSWIGFETTAIYGEETEDPKKSVPRATYIAVTTLGLFYAFAAYAGVMGMGDKTNEEALDLVDQYYWVLADMYTWPWVGGLMDFLVVTGFFACAFAFHNNAARYMFSMGRDGILPSALGRTHPQHKSPVTANGVQASVAILVVVIFAALGADPLLHLGTWVPIFCTLSILVVQMLVSLSVVSYFNKVGREKALDYWKTLIAPILGAIAQITVAYLLVSNLSFLAETDQIGVLLIPVYVLVIGLIGFFIARYLKKAAPDRFERIGTVYEEDELLEDEPEKVSAE